jgi:hypothetical protein
MPRYTFNPRTGGESDGHCLPATFPGLAVRQHKPSLSLWLFECVLIGRMRAWAKLTRRWRSNSPCASVLFA